METFLFGIGQAVAGVLFKVWLENSLIAKERGLSLDALIGRGISDRREQRAVKRQFEQIAEQIAERLTPFFDAEFGGLPENEKRAAGEEVRRTLEQANLTDTLLFAIDLSPQSLEAELLRNRPRASEEAFLSDAGAAFYGLLLREAANCVVEIRMTLPDFGTKAARTMLARETELLALVRSVLERLPAEGSSQVDGEAAAFETQYRRDVARKLDQLELFGVIAAETRYRYSLSVAYLTLTASTKLAPTDDEMEETQAVDGKEGNEGASVPVDTALSRSNRLLIRGEAGSGKTTLLQWIAVNSARKSFPESLSEWNDSFPFLVQLRRYVDSDLPEVEEFVSGLNVHLQQPAGWVRRQLSEGRGLVLVDGIDELPEKRRSEAHEWLNDLVELYPDNRYVVTSRPPAVGEDWLGGQGFDAVLLEPLELPAIRAFVDHWHAAALAAISDPEEHAELEELAGRLKVTVRENRAIRNLASSPLLCAMLCALNRGTSAELPSDRVELYQIALEMLLERRDLERKVKGDIVDLGRREKEILLRVFAWWLLNNGKSFAQRKDLEDLVAARLEGMPRVDATASEVVRHLLIRSGLLRQPAEDRVDFIHRTFQEYLAAKEAVGTRSMGVLIGHAHLDQWQEVIILAAGLAEDLSMREELIEGLIQRGDEEEETRHRVHLLAVGCLETSAELSPGLAGRVNALLEELIPPKSMTEARAIASAGEVAVPLLGQQAEGSLAVTAAACVRALGLIGSESALSQLERFGPDQRVTVARELLRAWDEFPAEEYARRVLSRSVLDYGRAEVGSAGQLSEAAHLERLEYLVCDGTGEATPGDQWPWHALETLPPLRRLTLFGIAGMTDTPKLWSKSQLRWLSIVHLPQLAEFSAANLPALESLSIAECSELKAAEGISTLKRLLTLRITGCRDLVELPALPPRLERAYFSRLNIGGLIPLEESDSLRVLTLISCRQLEDLSPITSHQKLRVLELDNCPELRSLVPVSELNELYALSVSGPGNGCDMAALSRCTDLKRLGLEDLASLCELSWINELSQLRLLSLAGSRGLAEMPPLLLPELRSLHLTECYELGHLGGVEELGPIEELYLDFCGNLNDLEPLRGHPTLTRLSLRGCRGISSLAPLQELPALKVLDIRGTMLDPKQLKGRDDMRILAGPRPAVRGRNRIGSGWSWRTDRWRDIP